MADDITVADIEAALAAARRTPSGRRSPAGVKLLDEHKQLCVWAANLFVATARDEARVRSGETKWLRPQPIDYPARFARHLETLEKLHREKEAWRARQDFFDLLLALDTADPMRAAADYFRALTAATSTVLTLIGQSEGAAGSRPKFVSAALGDDKANRRIVVNEPPQRAFERWIVMTAHVWKEAGNTATAELTKAEAGKPAAPPPFARFIDALNGRLPADVREKGGSLLHRIRNVLVRQRRKSMSHKEK